jgi:hypothetical protein
MLYLFKIGLDGMNQDGTYQAAEESKYKRSEDIN